MKVREAMTSDVRLTDPDRSIREAAQMMADQDIGSLPVGENDRLVGMVTDRDIVVRAVADDRPGGNTAVREVMSERVYYCFEDDDVKQAAKVMSEHQVRRLPVLNRNKRLTGVIALADLGRADRDAACEALVGVSEPSRTPRR